MEQILGNLLSDQQSKHARAHTHTAAEHFKNVFL